MPRDVVTTGLLEDRPLAGTNGATFYVVGPTDSRGLYVDDGVNWLPVDLARTAQVKVFGDDTAVTTGDLKASLVIDYTLDRLDLFSVQAFVTTASGLGLITVQIRRINRAPGDLLLTRVTIDANELVSYDAVTPSVVDPSVDTVRQGDILAIDVDGAGSGAKGLGVVLHFA